MRKYNFIYWLSLFSLLIGYDIYVSFLYVLIFTRINIYKMQVSKIIYINPQLLIT